MDHVSQRLGMSVQQMRDLNYDIASNDAVLQPGQELCVVPNSCKGLKDTFYTGMVYKDDKFYAASDWPVVAPSETAGGEGVPSTGNGEEVCENKGYAEAKCLSLGCCQWDPTTDDVGACWSGVGDSACASGASGK